MSFNTSAQIVYSDRNGYFDPVISDFTLRNIGLDYSFKIKHSEDHFTVKWLNDTTIISTMENLGIDSEEVGDYILHLRKGVFHDACCISQDSIVSNDTITYRDRNYGTRKTKSFEVYDTNDRILYGKYVYIDQNGTSTYSDQYSYELFSDTETVTIMGFHNDSMYSISKTSKMFSKGLLVKYIIQTTQLSPLKAFEHSNVFGLIYDKKRRLRKIVMYSETGKKLRVLKMKYD